MVRFFGKQPECTMPDSAAFQQERALPVAFMAAGTLTCMVPRSVRDGGRPLGAMEGNAGSQDLLPAAGRRKGCGAVCAFQPPERLPALAAPSQSSVRHRLGAGQAGLTFLTTNRLRGKAGSRDQSMRKSCSGTS